MAKPTLTIENKPIVSVQNWEKLIVDLNAINNNAIYNSEDNTFSGDNTLSGITTFSNETVTAANVGTASTGVTAVEYGAGGGRHKTVLTLSEFTQAIAGAALGFGKSLYTFPEGFIKVVYATADVTIAGATETGTPDIGVGTVVASGEIDALDGTATFEDIMDGFTGTAITSEGSDSNNYVEAESELLDGHTTAIEAFLNFAETWTASEDLTISGTVTLYWDSLGDY